MKKNLLRYTWLPVTAVVSTLALGQQLFPESSAILFAKAKADSPNRFSASYRAAFNIKTSFKDVAGVPAQSNPGPATGGVENRYYDDGYNLVDNNNNSYGDLQATRNWGYDNASQIVDSRYIVMHSSSLAAGTGAGGKDELQNGFELKYQREFGRYAKWRWGLEGSFGITWVSISDDRPQSGNINRINDSFEVPADDNGVRFIPPPGHRGSDREGPLLGSSPTRTTSVLPGGATITGARSFDADIYSFKLGPYVEIPLNPQWAFTLSAGLALAEVTSDLSFNETVSMVGAGLVNRAGSGSHNDLQLGGYVAGSVSYKVNKDWEIFAGAQFQGVGKYTHTVNGKEAALDLGKTVFVGAGASFSF